MEEGAAAAARKKIKPDRIDGQGHPKIGCPAGDQGLDFIGRLPDEVLCSIISLLRLKEGARTQILSCRWRPLWRTSPLSLEADRMLSSQERKRIVLVSKILSDHQGPARRFSLPSMRLRDRYAKIDGWLRSRALNSLENIHFSYEIEDSHLRYPLPPSALRFAPTLRVAEFGYCEFPRDVAPSLKFPCLKEFTLRSVIVLEDVLHSLLRGCPVLESLFLDLNAGVGCLRINSPTLRSIGMGASSCGLRVANPIMLQDLIIEDAPCLERLLPPHHGNGPATIRVVRAPKLEILGPLSDGITRLDLGTTVFQVAADFHSPVLYYMGLYVLVTNFAVLTTSVRTMKILALGSWGPCCKMNVIDSWSGGWTPLFM
jgi:hypothetical protein